MKRYLQDAIQTDLGKKMVMLSGPRQVGKTFVAKDIMKSFAHPHYLNYDNAHDAKAIMASTWPASSDLLVLDEIHKMRNWKSFLKGSYDVRPGGLAMLVTGSARLDTYRQTGESLAGRYFHYRLHPLSVKELTGAMKPALAIDTLNRLGGFPEPFLAGSDTAAARWRNQYYTDLVREDILEFSRVHEVHSMRVLLELLRTKVGAPLSYTSLATDLQLAPNTVKKYVDILEALHILFLVHPFHTNIARAILKEPKLYFYDTGYVKGDESVRLENTCAAGLLKHVDFEREVNGKSMELHHIRTKDNKEVDFAISLDGRIDSLIEVKLGDQDPPTPLRRLSRGLAVRDTILAVHHLRQESRDGNIRIVPAGEYLASLSA